MSTPSTTTWRFGDAHLVLVTDPAGPVRLLGVAGPGGWRGGPTDPPLGAAAGTALVELSLGAEGRIGTSPNAQHRRYLASSRLRYVAHDERRTPTGSVLTVVQHDGGTGLLVTSRLEHLTGADAFRTTTTVANDGAQPVELRFVSSLNLTGFGAAPIGVEPDRLRLTHARNAWFAESRWQTTTLEHAGIVDIGPVGDGNDSSMASFTATGFGSWSTGDFLPVGAVTDTVTGTCWTWQVEHDGAWQWQALDSDQRLAVILSGPTDDQHQWRTELAPGTSFTTVPAALAVSDLGLDGALAQMTAHRRSVRRPNADDRDCPVIFNDYMNCLMGDPTTARLLPLVVAAKAAGSEYFVIDAGWYSDEPGWWDSVGEWLPSRTRFPHGLVEVTDAIRAAGMVPGLWLEPEVVGVRSPLLSRLPPEALFQRDGTALSENGRYQLDFRHPAVTAHLDETVDRLVRDFGVGYFKFDYNVNIGVGTDLGGLAPGDGLLGHNRAYLAWLDRLFARHPDLVVENCSSGGMRADQAQLSRMSLQSTSDQTDPVRYAPIAASAPAAIPPEQSAVWAYPQPEWSADVNDLTVVNALLGRVHLSGRLDLLDEAGAARIAEAMTVYKSLRHRIPAATAVWPLGLPGWYDPWCAVGLTDATGVMLQLWRRAGHATVELPFPSLVGVAVQVRTLYPAGAPVETSWSAGTGVLTVTLPAAPSARLLELVRG